MAEEQKKGRGLGTGYVVFDDPGFTSGVMFTQKDQKRALGDLNQLHRDAKMLLSASLPALTGLQAAIKNGAPETDYQSILKLARQITADTETFSNRLAVIQQKIPTVPNDQAVVDSLHIATELQQWTEDWGNVVTPMIDSVEKMLENKDV